MRVKEEKPITTEEMKKKCRIILDINIQSIKENAFYVTDEQLEELEDFIVKERHRRFFTIKMKGVKTSITYGDYYKDLPKGD